MIFDWNWDGLYMFQKSSDDSSVKRELLPKPSRSVRKATLGWRGRASVIAHVSKAWELEFRYLEPRKHMWACSPLAIPDSKVKNTGNKQAAHNAHDSSSRVPITSGLHGHLPT